MLQVIYILFFKDEDMQLNTSLYTLPHFTNKFMSPDTKMMIWLENDEVCFFLSKTNGYLLAFRAFNLLNLNF